MNHGLEPSPGFLEELVGCSEFDEFAAVQNHDLVEIDDGCETVGDWKAVSDGDQNVTDADNVLQRTVDLAKRPVSERIAL